MPRPRKVETENVTLAETKIVQEIHTIIRPISKQNNPNPSLGETYMSEVDAYVNKWLKDGWKLFYMERLELTESVFTLMYVLIRDVEVEAE